MQEIKQTINLFREELLYRLTQKGGKVAIKLCEIKGLKRGTEEWKKEYENIRSVIHQEKIGRIKEPNYKFQKALISYYAYKRAKNSKYARVAFKAFSYSAELYEFLKMLQEVAQNKKT